MHFILSFMYHVFSAYGWSVQPKHVVCVDTTNKIFCGRRLYVYRFL